MCFDSKLKCGKPIEKLQLSPMLQQSQCKQLTQCYCWFDLENTCTLAAWSRTVASGSLRPYMNQLKAPYIQCMSDHHTHSCDAILFKWNALNAIYVSAGSADTDVDTTPAQTHHRDCYHTPTFSKTHLYFCRARMAKIIYYIIIYKIEITRIYNVGM